MTDDHHLKLKKSNVKKLKQLKKLPKRTDTSVCFHLHMGISFGSQENSRRSVKLSLISAKQDLYLTQPSNAGSDVKWIDPAPPHSCTFLRGRVVYWLCYHLSKLKYRPSVLIVNSGCVLREISLAATFLNIELRHECRTACFEMHRHMQYHQDINYKCDDRPGFLDIPGVTVDLFALLMATNAKFWESRAWTVLHTANIFEVRVPVGLVDYVDANIMGTLASLSSDSKSAADDADNVRDQARTVFVRVLGKGGRCDPTLKIDFNRVNVGLWATQHNDIRKMGVPHPSGSPGTLQYVCGQGAGFGGGVLEPVDANAVFEYGLPIPHNNSVPWSRMVHHGYGGNRKGKVGGMEQKQRMLTAREVCLVTYCLHAMTVLAGKVRGSKGNKGSKGSTNFTPAFLKEAAQSRTDERAYHWPAPTSPTSPQPFIPLRESFAEVVRAVVGTEQRTIEKTLAAIQSTKTTSTGSSQSGSSQSRARIIGPLTGHSLTSSGGGFVLRWPSLFVDRTSVRDLEVDISADDGLVGSAHNTLDPSHPDYGKALDHGRENKTSLIESIEREKRMGKLCLWCARYGWQVERQGAKDGAAAGGEGAGAGAGAGAVFHHMLKCGGCKRALYCSKACQMKHWKCPLIPGGTKKSGAHKKLCKVWQKERKQVKREIKGKMDMTSDAAAAAASGVELNDVDYARGMMKKAADAILSDELVAHITLIEREGLKHNTDEKKIKSMIQQNIITRENVVVAASFQESMSAMGGFETSMKLLDVLEKCRLPPEDRNKSEIERGQPSERRQAFKDKEEDRPELKTAKTAKERAEHAKLHEAFGGCGILPENSIQVSKMVRSWMEGGGSGETEGPEGPEGQEKETPKEREIGVTGCMYQWASLTVVDIREPMLLTACLADNVMVAGLKSAQYNGRTGVRGVYSPLKGRVLVHLNDASGRVCVDGKGLWLRPENVFPMHIDEIREGQARMMKIQDLPDSVLRSDREEFQEKFKVLRSTPEFKHYEGRRFLYATGRAVNM